VRVVDVLISHVIPDQFYLHKTNRGSKFTSAPEMSARIAQSCFRMMAEKQESRTAFQDLHCLRGAHAQTERNSAMNVLWLHVHLDYFYSVQ